MSCIRGACSPARSHTAGVQGCGAWGCRVAGAVARAGVVGHECERLSLLELRLGPRADLAHHRHEVDVHAWLGLGLGCRL
eukprot:scaffold7308_cov48-Phaeocystis_antarctica.AAC.2